MSNIRLNTIVPDSVNNPNGLIQLPGSLSVTALQSTSLLDATGSSAALSVLGGISIGKSLRLGGNITFSPSTVATVLQQSTNEKSLILAGGSSSTYSTGATLELNGATVLSGSSKLTTAAGGSFSIQSGNNVSAVFTSTGSLIINGTSSSTSPSTGALVLASGGLSIASTEVATSATSGGALTVAGGMAIGGSLFVGGTFGASGGFTNSEYVRITATTESSGIGSGSLTTDGGAAVAKKLYVGGIATFSAGITSTAPLTITDTSGSSFSTAGGATIGTTLSVGSYITATAGMSISGIISSTNATDSTLPANGAASFAGGVGVLLNLRVGQGIFGGAGLTLSNATASTQIAGTFLLTNTTDTNALNTGAFILASGISVGQNAYLGKNLVVIGSATLPIITSSTIGTNAITITSTTAGTSPTTGSLVVNGGGLGLNAVLYASGRSYFTNTSDALSLSDASTVFSGGVAIGLSTFVGGSLRVTGTTYLGTVSTGATTSSGILTITDATPSISSTSGSAVFAGGVGIAGNLNLGGYITVAGSTSLTGNLTTSGLVTLNNTTDASSLTIASFIVNGGAAVKNTLRVGGNVISSGALTVSGVTTVLNATPSTGSANGAFVVSGGVGIGQSLFIGNSLNVSGVSNLLSNLAVYGTTVFSNTTDSGTASDGAVVVTGGVGIMRSVSVGQNIVVGGNGTVNGTSTLKGDVAITSTTVSSSYANGALTVSGGLGVAGRFNCNGNVLLGGTSTFVGTSSFTNITDSGNAGEGAVVVSGGVGIGRNLNVAGGFSVGAAATIAGILTNTAGSIFLNTVSLTDVSGAFTVLTPAPSLRLAATNAVKTAQYVNFLDLFSLGNTYADINHESLQLTTTSTNTYTIMSRSAGTGVPRRIVLQSGSGNAGQLILNTDGTVQAGANTTDSTLTSNGSLVVSGGLGVGGSVSIKNRLSIFAGTSGNVSLSAPATVTTYNLVLPAAPPTSNNYALVSDINGSMSWSQMTTPNPTFVSVGVTSTTSSDSAVTGALTVAGGIGVSGAVYGAGTMTSSLATTAPNFFGVSSSTDQTAGLRIQNNNGTFWQVGIAGSAPTSTYSTIGAAGLGFFNSATGTVPFYVTSGNSVVIASTVPSTNTGTGSLRVAGGVGIAGNVNVGGSLTLPRTTGTGDLTIGTTVQFGRAGVAGNYFTDSAAGDLIVKNAGGNIRMGVTNGGSAMTISSAGVVTMNTVTPTTGTGIGALVVAGGISSGSSLSIKGSLLLAGATSGMITVTPPAVVTSYTLTLPSTVAPAANYALVSDTAGSLSWSEMTTANPNFVTANISSTAPSTGIGSGALKVSGGASIGAGLSIKGGLIFAGGTSGSAIITSPAVVTPYTLTLPSTVAPAANYALVSDTNGVLTWSEMTTSNPTFVTASVNSTAPSTGIGSGALKVTGGASIGAGLSIKGGLRMAGGTSGTVTLLAPDTTTTNPVFVLPASVPSSSGQALVADTDGNLTFAPMSGNAVFTMTGLNNAGTPVAIRGMNFTGMFKTDVKVYISTTTVNLNAMYTLRGYPTDTGYQMYQNYVGDDTGVDFTVDASGNIYYTSTNMTNWTGTTFTWTGPQAYSTPAGGTPVSIAGANNQTTPADVTGMIMKGPQFSTYILVSVANSTAANSTSSSYLLEGVVQPSGIWQLSQSITGPDPGIVFSVLPSGQVQYTSKNVTGWLSTRFQFYPPTTPLQQSGAYSSFSVTGTTNATSSSSGSFTVSGGAGIAQDIFVGGSVKSAALSVGTIGYGVSSTSIDIGDTVVGARWRVQNGGNNLNFLQNDGVGNYVQRSYIAGSTGAFTGPVAATTVTISDTADAALQVSGGAYIVRNLRVGNTSYNTEAIELGNYRTSDGNSFLDFHSAVGTDYDARIIRSPGANGGMDITQTGTGPLQLFSAAGGINLVGFTRLGGASGSGIKTFVLTGTLPAAGSTFTVGLPAGVTTIAKIASLTGIAYGSNVCYPGGMYGFDAAWAWRYWVNGASLNIAVEASANYVAGAAYRILLTIIE